MAKKKKEKISFKNKFWRIYYRLTMGQEKLDKILHSATLISTNLKESTKGNLAHFHDVDGNQIRGWYKKSISFQQHPLIQKYR